MQNIFLDSCVWISYVWQTQFTNKAKKESASTSVIKKIDGDNNFQIILSPFLISEISSHFRDWYNMQKAIKDGYSYRDFTRVKKDYELTDKEVEKIDDIIIKIGGIENVNVLLPENIKKEDIETILNYEVKYQFDFYDALHVFVAMKNKCKYFITTDTPLRKCIAKLNHGAQKIESLPPKSFEKIINS